MTDKMLRVDAGLHRQLKIAALMQDITLRAFTDKALRDALPDKARVLVDTREPYTVKGENDA